MGSLNRIDRPEPDAGYDTDFYAWSLDQAALIRSLNVPGLDTENIAEEIESLGRSDKSELLNRCTVLIGHLLKWTYQAERRGTSWRLTIAEQRSRISDLLAESPSLRPVLPEILSKAYQRSTRYMSIEIDEPISTFPLHCQWTSADILNEDWLPE